MFSFGKKIFLVDLLEGFIDIHNHILPGIDDGAKTVEDSFEMIDALNKLGFEGLIHTPHIMPGVHPNTPDTIANAEKLEFTSKVSSAFNQTEYSCRAHD